MIGIYCIENIINNKKYIGQSINIEERQRKHREALRNNRHENDHLQKSWNKYGEYNFKHYILETCEPDQLNDREIYYIKLYDTLNSGYNLTEGGGGVRGQKADDEFRAKMSRIVSGKNNPNYGHHWSQELKDKLSQKKKGTKLGKDNPRATKIICVETGDVSDTIMEAADKCCIPIAGMTRCLKNPKYVNHGFHFVKYDNDSQLTEIRNNKFQYMIDHCYPSGNQKMFADMTNKQFYDKTDLLKILQNSTDMTTREIRQLLEDQTNFKINDIQYVLL